MMQQVCCMCDLQEINIGQINYPSIFESPVKSVIQPVLIAIQTTINFPHIPPKIIPVLSHESIHNHQASIDFTTFSSKNEIKYYHLSYAPSLLILQTNLSASMADETIFDKLIRKEIPSSVVFEDEFVFAFRDIAPVAPTHILIIPKHKDGLTGISKAQDKHEAILGKLLIAAAKIAKQEHLGHGYRLVINEGEHAGQAVPHLHVHLLGGKQFGWPPGTSL